MHDMNVSKYASVDHDAFNYQHTYSADTLHRGQSALCCKHDELHAVRKTRDGKVTLQLGKTTIPAEVWMAKQTRRFRNFSPNTPGYLGPKSSTNANNVEVYSQKRGWVPLKSLPDKP